MKKLLIGSLFLLACAVLFGLPFENMRYTYYNDGIGLYSFEFSQGEIILQDWQKYEDQKEEDSIELPGYPGLYCKVFKDTYNLIRQDGFLIVKTKKRSFICLFKNSDICVLVEIDSSPISTKRVYWGINSSIIQKTKQKTSGIFTPEWDSKIKVSTFLPGTTKGGIKYKPPFGRIEYGAIWIEDGKGKGIGEWIEIDNSQTTDKMLFLNGVILPGSPSSFIENGRIKKLQIDFDGFSQIAELADTPNPQVVFLDRKACNTKIRVTILEVYDGAKYMNCGLSFLGTLSTDMTLK